MINSFCYLQSNHDVNTQHNFHLLALHHFFRDIITYFRKFKKSHVTVTASTQGTVCNPSAKTSWRTSVQNFKFLALAVLETFERKSKNLNGARDHNHAPLSGLINNCRRCAGTSYEVSSVSNLKSPSSLTSKIWNATKNAEIGVFFGLGIAQGQGLSLISKNFKTSRDHDHAHSRDSL